MQHLAYGDPGARIYDLVVCLITLYVGRHRQISVWIDFGGVERLLQLRADAIIAQSLRDAPRRRQGFRRRLASCLWLSVPSAGRNKWLGVSIDTEQPWPVLLQRLGIAAADRLEIVLADWRSGLPAQDTGPVWQMARVLAATVCLADDLQVPQARFWQWSERPFIGRDLVPPERNCRDGMLPLLSFPAPTIGQNNEDVLNERLTLSAAEHERLECERVIGRAD